jgi:B12-binding domain/radical SAM domain protein of rhizo-twelve system
MADIRDWSRVRSVAVRSDDSVDVNGGPAAGGFNDLPPLRWPDEWVARHCHHHPRFDAPPAGPGAKIDFRGQHRRRDLPILLAEIDGLLAQGVRYLYFIDEIFLPWRPLLEALAQPDVAFGVQTRIDLWKPDMLRLPGAAGCVSIEAGIERLAAEWRAALVKRCRLETQGLARLLIEARLHVPFVQANLIGVDQDDPGLVGQWRSRLIGDGVWANAPVPLYPYPSSPGYRAMWGAPDDAAWERAHEHYLRTFSSFSDIQDERPVPLPVLEASCCAVC